MHTPGGPLSHAHSTEHFRRTIFPRAFDGALPVDRFPARFRRSTSGGPLSRALGCEGRSRRRPVTLCLTSLETHVPSGSAVSALARGQGGTRRDMAVYLRIRPEAAQGGTGEEARRGGHWGGRGDAGPRAGQAGPLWDVAGVRRGGTSAQRRLARGCLVFLASPSRSPLGSILPLTHGTVFKPTPPRSGRSCFGGGR